MMLAPKSMCSVPGSFIENEALLICIIYIQKKSIRIVHGPRSPGKEVIWTKSKRTATFFCETIPQSRGSYYG